MSKYVSQGVSIVAEYQTKNGYKVNCAAIGNENIFCTGDDSKCICLWSTQSRTPIKVLTGQTSGISKVLFSPDTKYLFAGTKGGSIHVWDIEAQKNIVTLREHKNSCSSLSVPCESLISTMTSGSQDTVIKVWDLHSGKSFFTLKGHEGTITSTCFSPNGQWLGSSSDNGDIKVT